MSRCHCADTVCKWNIMRWETVNRWVLWRRLSACHMLWQTIPKPEAVRTVGLLPLFACNVCRSISDDDGVECRWQQVSKSTSQVNSSLYVCVCRCQSCLRSCGTSSCRCQCPCMAMASTSFAGSSCSVPGPSGPCLQLLSFCWWKDSQLSCILFAYTGR